MAKNKKAPKNLSNIIKEYNTARLGLDMDSSDAQIIKGKLSYALNSVVENFDSNSINYQNEPGNIFCLEFPENFLLIGRYFINEQSKHIFWLTNPLTGENELGYMVNNDCVYHTLATGACLGFDINFPIQKVVHRITNCTTEIYWPDNVGRRYLDIDNIPYKLLSGTAICDPVYSNELDCNQLKVQPDFSIPYLDVTAVNTGGNLISGTYQFAIKYSDQSGAPLTSFYSITNPCPIIDPFTVTINFNTPVGKSIVINVSNIDLSGLYDSFTLVVIKTINNIPSSEVVGVYSITGHSMEITYTGQNKEAIQISMNEIFEKFPYYDKAEDLTAARDVLIWKGLTTVDQLNYQSIFNKVNLQWESYRIPANEGYSDELNATNYRSYLRDETYAIEGLFLLTNGRQTDKFHIPGPAITATEQSQGLIDSNHPDFVGNPTRIIGDIGYSPYWKIYNTAVSYGYSLGRTDDKGYKGPWEHGKFGYTESIETYPCNEDVWGELAGKPIRHHKFPDVLVSPISESTMYTNDEGMVMEDAAVYPLGIRIDLQQIQFLIDTSTELTQEQKDEIVGIKIVRGNRGTNKSVIAKGILRNVNTYNREGQDYYFPNYPYNDLSEDPFLNKVNNARKEDCEQFEVAIYQLTEEDDEGPFATLKYTDCNTGKVAYKIYREITPMVYPTPTWYDSPFGQTIPEEERIRIPDFDKICSLGKPVVTSPGDKNRILRYINSGEDVGSIAGGDFDRNKWYRREYAMPIIHDECVATVSYSNYDIWKLYNSITYGIMSFDFQDTITNAFTVEVTNSMGYKVRVKVGTTPRCTAGCDSTAPEDQFLDEEIRTEECSVEKPLPGIRDVGDGYRQVFNSPETSFGQPFLGATLKLESAIYGTGKDHFVQVKNNAKYRLLTEEAQRDALESANAIASSTTPANPVALFAAYSAYLEIYINGITRKNTGYSYNSIASYNYSAPVENDGNKQRQLDIFRYLIPGVQAVGEENPVNNYHRESSVFLKTKGTLEGDTTPALPFPDEIPSIPTGFTDRSRTTASASDRCSTPAKEKPIYVLSYYGSIKNLIDNQWGQIYSYTTVDTGFQEQLPNTSRFHTVFGGDTFINKFAFKTKLPFFIDNRVNGLDDSDIFYDEIGNIAYPTYWHSARSVLKDAEGAGITLTNFISYKDHNFDCPNDQSLATGETPEDNPDRTFYDGYFYLFAYGMPSFYCESSYNTDLRQAFNDREGEYWPHVSDSIPDDWVQEDRVSIANDNTYHYNVTYSKQNKENTFTNLPPDWNNKMCYTHFPFRAIYSDIQNDDQSNQTNNWLIYRAVSYFDFPQNFGKFVSIDGIQDKAVLARFENRTLMYNNLLTMDTSNPQAAYIGNSQLFRGAPPVDFADTDLGFVGTQNKMLLKIPTGQVTIDAKRGHIFMLQGQTPNMISRFGSGMNSFLKEHLPFQMLKYFPDTQEQVEDELITIPGINVDNHFNGVGIHGVYDNRFERIIITKLDYIPLDENIVLDPYTQIFTLDGKEVRLDDPDYFCNRSWTLSFNINTSSWVSFHSYIPNYYIAENNHFYSGKNNCCNDFDFIAGEIVATPTTTTTTTLYSPRCAPFKGVAVELFVKECEPLTGTVVITDCTLTGTGQIITP